jgi:hypothetical protein
MSDRRSKLSLNRETVRELSSDELGQVAGARVPIQSPGWGCLPSQAGCTGYYPSYNAPCESRIICQ